MRVEAAHRFDIPVERGFAFITDIELVEFLAGVRAAREGLELAISR